MPAEPGALDEEPEAPGLVLLPAPAPPPEVALSDVPELPDVPELLDEGGVPEGEPLDGGVPGEAAGGVAPGDEDEDVPDGEAPDEDDEELSAPVDGVEEDEDEEGEEGVLGVVALLLLLGEDGVLLAAPLEVDPGAADEPEPAPLPASLLQPASSAASTLAVNSTLEE